MTLTAKASCLRPSLPYVRVAMALLMAGAALLVSGCERERHDGLFVVKLQADWYPQPEHGGFYTALNKGYYKAEGLDVEILPSSPYASSEAMVARGISQFGMNSSDHVIEAIANADEPLIAVGATMQHDPQGIMVHAESPVHTWTDLDGHTIAVRPGSTWWEFIVRKFHLGHVHEIPATYSVATFLHDPNYIQQGFVTSEPYFAEREGAHTRMLLNSEAGFDPYRVFYTSREFAAEHPDVVAKFTRASIHGWKDYMNDPRETNALLLKLNPALNADWEQFSWRQLKSGNFITGDAAKGEALGQFDAVRWQQMYQQLRDLHVIKKAIDPRTAYTTQFNR
jgi:NitT/TauT family transport system substrate-binding protein